MDANRTPSGGGLKSELARFCLPAGNRDPNRKLAWVNSICILFLLIGLAGARSAAIQIKAPPPLEEVVPTIVEPLLPPPSTAEQPQPHEQSDQKTETPQVVVVTPNAPSVSFPVPTIGNLVVPNAVALAPPAEPLKNTRAFAKCADGHRYHRKRGRPPGANLSSARQTNGTTGPRSHRAYSG